MPEAAGGVVWFDWVKRIVTGAPDPDNSFLAGKGSWLIERDGAFGEKVCIASALSVGWCLGTAVVGKPGKKPEGREGSLAFVPAGAMVSKESGNNGHSQILTKITGSIQLS